MIVLWESGPSVSGPCPLCSAFAGKLWHLEVLPRPPLHPDCKCTLVPIDHFDPALVQNELTNLSEATRNDFIRLTVFYLTSKLFLPAILEQFRQEAMNRINSNADPDLIPFSFTAEGELRAVLVEPGRTRTITNQPGRHTFTAAAIIDAYDRGLFCGIPCNIDHASGHPSVRDILGIWTDVTNDNGRITASLTTYHTDYTRPIIQLLEQIKTTPSDHRPDIGLSLVLYPSEVGTNGEINSIQMIESADLVLHPAVNAARFQFHTQGEHDMTDPTPIPDPTWTAEFRRVQSAAIIDLTSDLPALVKSRLKTADYPTPDDLNAAIDAARQELAALHDANVISLPGRPRIQVRDPLEEAQTVADFIFGAQSTAVPSNMRRVDEWYKALTGDHEFRGTFDETRISFAGASSSTLANLAVNAMNKVLVEQMANMTGWRWYEFITSVEPNDGTLNPMQWITIGGISNLPTVAEGASYTELAVNDAKESSSFTKLGGYVGITRELLKNSDIGRLQAIPRALATAAIRSRSAAVSAIFTANAGAGPTLAQDTTPLFHTANHVNLLTSALGTDATAWREARTECFKHSEVGSGKPLGVFPKFLLVPADLFDQALVILGYGDGTPIAYTPEAQSRGQFDPRPVPILVPDWTDATDWAYIVDPAVFPVIQMSYSQNPGGRSHPAPELFAVTGQTNGLLFTNDTLPIKVRDEFAVGVNGPRGIGKRNVGP